MTPPGRTPWPRDARRLGGGGGPIFNLPRMIGWLIGINLAVHVLRFLLPVPYDDYLIFNFGFIPALFSYQGPLPLSILASPLTYMFLHGSLAHVLINMATLAAFGTPIERLWGPGRTLACYAISGIVAAFAHFVIYPGSPVPMVGASGAISGLFGATLMMLRAGRGGDSRMAGTLIALWIGMTVLFALFDFGFGGESVAWVAHLGGFAAGLALYPLLRPRWMRRG